MPIRSWRILIDSSALGQILDQNLGHQIHAGLAKRPDLKLHAGLDLVEEILITPVPDLRERLWRLSLFLAGNNAFAHSGFRLWREGLICFLKKAPPVPYLIFPGETVYENWKRMNVVFGDNETIDKIRAERNYLLDEEVENRKRFRDELLAHPQSDKLKEMTEHRCFLRFFKLRIYVRWLRYQLIVGSSRNANVKEAVKSAGGENEAARRLIRGPHQAMLDYYRWRCALGALDMAMNAPTRAIEKTGGPDVWFTIAGRRLDFILLRDKGFREILARFFSPYGGPHPLTVEQLLEVLEGGCLPTKFIAQPQVDGR